MTSKESLNIGTRVKIRGKGVAEVIDLCLHLQFYVRVRLVDGTEPLAMLADLSLAPAPKLTKEERYTARVEVIRNSPIAYRIAGWLATHESNFHVSAPPKQLEATKNLLDSYHIDYDGVTLTESTDKTQGRSFSVVTENHGMANQLFEATKVNSTIYHDNSDKVSIQAREFVVDFLLGDLHFKLGKVQDMELISESVPAQFVEDFMLGMASAVAA